MKLPNAANAVVELEKLTEYLLNPDHPRGKHKARVLENACGLTIDHAESVRQELLTAATLGEAVPQFSDAYGQRFMVECNITGPSGSAMLVTAWIIRSGEDFPRFVSAYVR